MLYKEANALVAKTFNDHYFRLHDYIYTTGDVVKSRNGDTREVLNFKTQLTNPTHRCVAGYNRNVNIFFLMAEAMWIFKGRRDVEFLDIFNGQMKNYSDDGKYFWAPYGWRMRYHGVDPSVEAESNNLHYVNTGIDQLDRALCMLDLNPTDRRVVISIWDPVMDLGANKKDLPCNDMLMFKVREGCLHQTIQNRSNDLNWGLTTNVFQFSFLGEVMADILGIRYGTQTHNSQSLHIYTNVSPTQELQNEFRKGDYHLWRTSNMNHIDLYTVVRTLPIHFNFRDNNLNVQGKLYWVDFYLHSIIVHLQKQSRTTTIKDDEGDELFEEELKYFCYHFWCVYKILQIYVSYKNHHSHQQAISDLLRLNKDTDIAVYDFFLLSVNFFLRRLKDKPSQNAFDSNLEIVHSLIPAYKGLPLGSL